VLQSPELAALLSEASAALELGPTAFEHASQFLHSAGQSNMVSQSQQARSGCIVEFKGRIGFCDKHLGVFPNLSGVSLNV